MRFRGLAEALRTKAFREFIENHPMYNAMLRNTVTLTMLKAGEKINVIPTESAVQFDARILPAEDAERFIRQVRKVAGREVEVVPTTGSESIPSSFNTPYFRAIAARVRKMKPHVSALPFLTTGATDLRYFRNMGIIAYGFFPMILTRDELFRMHGINERISVENLEVALAGTIEIVKSLATYSPPV
jgi:acetylornithine deacetylase/succinyl-diaminopimelate desuccinylase-like protein